jgi:hypothetical protein
VGAKRHHVISAGYQRAWADGGRILYVDKRAETGWLVGVKDAFVAPNLLTLRDGPGPDDFP